MIAAAPALQPELLFCEESHVYKWRGSVIPGVTSMLSQCGLVDSAWFSEQAAIRGQAVHQAIHLFTEGRLEWDALDEDYAPYVASWMDCCAEHDIKPIFSELALASDNHWFAGRIDMIAAFRQECVIDFKSMLVAPAKCQQWWQIQRRLYRMLAIENGIIDQWSFDMSVVLTPSGYRLPKDVLSNDEADDAANAVLTLMKLRRAK